MDEPIDPITLEVIKNALTSVADELALIIMRTAYSNIVRDAFDFSTSVCDHEGKIVAQSLTNPNHLGAFPDAMTALMEQCESELEDGDVFIFNEPYGAGGVHLPDFYIIKPVFLDARLEAFVVTLAHQCDVGGIAPGGMAVYATEIFQEGLRLPILKLYEAGKPNNAIFRIIEQNVRLPRWVLGDIGSQLAACGKAEVAMRGLIARYGAGTFRRYTHALHDYAERLIRAEIAAMPDGTYRYQDWIDGLGADPTPLHLNAALTISGDGISIDWSGTSTQVKAAINAPMPATRSASYTAVRLAISAPIPNCEGFMRAIAVSAPEGSIVNPTEPAACGARGILMFRMVDALLGAFAQALPERIPAANEGGSHNPHIAGRHKNNEAFHVSGGLLGSWGGSHHRDGLDAVSNYAANLGNAPVELLEANEPIEITCYALVQNSGGPGRSRGGLALMRGYRLLADEAVLIIRTDRRTHRPYGLSGGQPGTPSWNIINPGATQQLLPVCPMRSTPMVRNDEFLHVHAGGGGFGDPLERDVSKVLEDVLDELYTVEYAADVYGVVIEGETVDLDATRERRLDLRRRDVGDESYLSHFYRTIGVPAPDDTD
jgi:N-methylhydantoinase B